MVTWSIRNWNKTKVITKKMVALFSLDIYGRAFSIRLQIILCLPFFRVCCNWIESAYFHWICIVIDDSARNSIVKTECAGYRLQHPIKTEYRKQSKIEHRTAIRAMLKFPNAIIVFNLHERWMFSLNAIAGIACQCKSRLENPVHYNSWISG